MGFKSYTLKLILRVMLLFGSMCLLAFLIFKTILYYNAIVLSVVIVLQLWDLIHFLHESDRRLNRFLSAIIHNDFSQHFSGTVKYRSTEKPEEVYSAILKKFQELRLSEEEKHIFLNMLTQRAGVGLITVDGRGVVSMFNEEAQKILGIIHLVNIRALDNISNGLGARLMELKPGEKTLIKLYKNEDLLQLVVKASAFKTNEGQFTLLSLQHIGVELEEQEYNAWQKLISVLTHEVMNSLTPIVSLAGTAKVLASNMSQLDNNTNKDLTEALDIIEDRGNGIISFINAYRRLSKVPSPEFREISLMEFFERLKKLFTEKLKAESLSFRIIPMPVAVCILADSDLLEQVFINLIKNAIDAGKSGEPVILTIETKIDGDLFIIVADNGSGISEDLRDKIFVPFFSAKEHGSGVGLSLCKQIMRAHGGDIHLKNTGPDENGASFVLSLPRRNLC